MLVNGVQVGLITPSGTKYLLYQTLNFTVPAGTYAVQFVGMAPAAADSTAFIDDAAINNGCAISEGSFEQPALAAGAYAVDPGGSSWQFFGDAGVSSNNSAFTTGNPSAPAGNQVAFIKNNASISQSVYLTAGFFNISFMAAQRDKSQTQYQELEILVDGNVVGTVTPTGTDVRPVPDAEFHRGQGRLAYDPVPRLEPQGRQRQHRLHRWSAVERLRT